MDKSIFQIVEKIPRINSIMHEIMDGHFGVPDGFYEDYYTVKTIFRKRFNDVTGNDLKALNEIWKKVKRYDYESAE